MSETDVSVDEFERHAEPHFIFDGCICWCPKCYDSIEDECICEDCDH